MNASRKTKSDTITIKMVLPKAAASFADAVYYQARAEAGLETAMVDFEAKIREGFESLPRKDGLIDSASAAYKALQKVYKDRRRAGRIDGKPESYRAAALMTTKDFDDMPKGDDKDRIGKDRADCQGYVNRGWSRWIEQYPTTKSKARKPVQAGSKKKASPKKVQEKLIKNADVRKIATVTAHDAPLLLALKWAATDGKDLFMKFAAANMPQPK